MWVHVASTDLPIEDDGDSPVLLWAVLIALAIGLVAAAAMLRLRRRPSLSTA
ncbi:MAG: hypothetical protein WAP35_10115 [Solirubrobacterales bacterium]